MANTSGIGLPQIGKDSLLRYQRDYYFAPEGIVTNKIVASVDPSTLTVGTALTLQTAANGLLLRRARIPTLILTDSSGGSGGLTVTVAIVGARWGQEIRENLTCTCVDGNPTTAKAVNVYDEIISATPINSLSTAASGDALTMGIDNTTFGLDFPIDNVADVISIVNTSTNTEQAATAISSSTVGVGPGAGLSTIKGITLATTDRWEIRYLASVVQDGAGTRGVFR